MALRKQVTLTFGRTSLGEFDTWVSDLRKKNTDREGGQGGEREEGRQGRREGDLGTKQACLVKVN